MTIPELTEEQRIESFIKERLEGFQDLIKFESKEEFAKFCIKEIDYVMDVIESTDIKDVEEQFEE